MTVVLIAFALLFALVLGRVTYTLKQKRIAALRALAARFGCTFAVADPGNVLGLPFALLKEGDARGVENFIIGQQVGRPVVCFDYWYYDESTNSNGSRSRDYHRYTCGLLTIEASTPHLRLGREGVLSRIGHAIGIDDLELEYEDFNREFRVRCEDQRFAFSFLDGRMMDWLLGAPEFEVIEVVGPHVLVGRHRLPPEAWPSLPVFLGELRDRVPDVVFTIYPPS